MMSTKRLERSERNRIIAGLFGGLGEYLNVDPNILRLVGVVLLILAPGLMVLLYALGALLIPKRGGRSYLSPEVDWQTAGPVLVGAVLVLLGSSFLSMRLGFPFPLRLSLEEGFQIGAGATLLVIGLLLLAPHLRRI